MIERKRTKCVRIGERTIGGAVPIVVQSMVNIPTSQVSRVVKQINDLAQCGCGLVRVSILTLDDIAAVQKILPQVSIPVCVDIHFSHELAIAAINAGAPKIRINPGNIGGSDKVRAVFRAARAKKTAVRIGVNSGSLETHIYTMKERVAGMVASLKRVITLADKERFGQLVLSIKSSEPWETIEANRLLAEKTSYPIHLGVTATGAGIDAVIKSTAALGTLLAEGIGDTIRVSLTAHPREEVMVGKKILQALGIMEYPYEVIACPTCGRTEINIQKLVRDVERRIATEFDTAHMKYKKIAIMGCVVNGPGEAKEADIGVAGGRGFGFIFKKGKRLCKVAEKDLVSALIAEMKK